MRTRLALLGLFLVLLNTSEAARRKKSKLKPVLTLEDAGVCPGKDLQMSVNYTINGKNDYRINVEYNMTERVEEAKFENIVLLCEDAAGTRCEPLVNFPVDDWCQFVTNNNEIWTAISKYYDRPHVCPLEGRYRIVGLESLVVGEALWKVGGHMVQPNGGHYHWTLSVTSSTTGHNFYCMYIIVSVQLVKA